MSECKNKNSFRIGMQMGLNKQLVHIFTSHIGHIQLAYPSPVHSPSPVFLNHSTLPKKFLHHSRLPHQCSSTIAPSFTSVCPPFYPPSPVFLHHSIVPQKCSPSLNPSSLVFLYHSTLSPVFFHYSTLPHQCSSNIPPYLTSIPPPPPSLTSFFHHCNEECHMALLRGNALQLVMRHLATSTCLNPRWPTSQQPQGSLVWMLVKPGCDSLIRLVRTCCTI